MPHQSIEEDIALSNSLEILITAYQKVSVSRMQKIRFQVLAARAFTEELAQVYYEVRSGQKRFTELTRKLFPLKNRPFASLPLTKPLVVMLSSNSRLDGGISQAIFRPFSEYVRQHPCDIIISGEVGKTLFRNSFPEQPFEYIPLPPPPISSTALAPLVKATSNHTDVRIFYGKFINFINQQPAMAKLADEQSFLQPAGKNKPNSEYFIFEPTMPAVVAYFDTQILTALMSRTSQEASLAEHGSRVTAMEQARQRIDTLLKQLSQKALNIQREMQNKRQREQLASISLWNA